MTIKLREHLYIVLSRPLGINGWTSRTTLEEASPSLCHKAAVPSSILIIISPRSTRTMCSADRAAHRGPHASHAQLNNGKMVYNDNVKDKLDIERAAPPPQ
ncbi:hypothetical protein VOLCADRAFT_88504, partial [Volvox carteri f. nagariensis]